MYKLIINTNLYAGNFERELTAHCTGIIGECEVGNEMIEDDIADMFIDSIASISDDRGWSRPCAIFNDNDNYNSVCIFFSEKPTQGQIDIIKSRCLTFNQKMLKRNYFYSQYPERWEQIEFKGFKLIDESTQQLIENI